MVAPYLLRLIFRMRRIHRVCTATLLLPVSRETLIAQLSATCNTYQFVAVIIIRLTIPSIHVRILVLICVGVGLGLGFGVGVCACVSCRVLPGVADDVDACMDGLALDGIRVASNSTIQSFTEYHDNACARSTALQNSRVVRAPQGRGGTERTPTGSRHQVRLSAGKVFFFPAAVKKVAWRDVGKFTE